VLFGWKNIPKLGDSLGKGIKNFRSSLGKDSVDVTPVKEELLDSKTAPSPVEAEIKKSENKAS
jgi:Sec-independent protein translocase protein TatA